jgi:hypothetical protein
MPCRREPSPSPSPCTFEQHRWAALTARLLVACRNWPQIDSFRPRPSCVMEPAPRPQTVPASAHGTRAGTFSMRPAAGVPREMGSQTLALTPTAGDRGRRERASASRNQDPSDSSASLPGGGPCRPIPRGIRRSGGQPVAQVKQKKNNFHHDTTEVLLGHLKLAALLACSAAVRGTYHKRDLEQRAVLTSNGRRRPMKGSCARIWRGEKKIYIYHDHPTIVTFPLAIVICHCSTAGKQASKLCSSYKTSSSALSLAHPSIDRPLFCLLTSAATTTRASPSHARTTLHCTHPTFSSHSLRTRSFHRTARMPEIIHPTIKGESSHIVLVSLPFRYEQLGALPVHSIQCLALACHARCWGVAL